MGAEIFPLADDLDDIRADIELASGLPMTADPRRVVDRHAPRLLAAVEAVLELHVPSVTADLREICPSCGWVAGKIVPADECEIREAITRSLTGKGGTDERG